MSLYHISDSSGELEITQVSTKPLLQKMLKSEDAFLVDSGSGAVYAWIGKEASKGTSWLRRGVLECCQLC